MSPFRKAIDFVTTRAKNFATGFDAQGEDKYISAAMMAGTVGGAAMGILLATAFWPVAVLGGVAGSFVLTVANWNGDFKSRALTALIGFPLGVVFAPIIGGGMLGAYAGQKVLMAVRAPTGTATEPAATPAAGDAPAASTLGGADLAPAFDNAADKGHTAAAPAATPTPKADAPRTPGK